jgi:RNA polymerase sigma-70 factor (ECF subfamily)
VLGERFDQVLARAVVGDVAAMAELWADAHPSLMRYLRMTAGDPAEDVASETWLRVIDGLGGFSGGERGFRRWLATIARNVHVDHLRRQSRRPEAVTADMSTVALPRSMAAPDPADVVSDRLGTDRAVRLIATLPADQAQMVMLRVVLGLDVGEVAGFVGRSPGAVRVAVHRALRRLELTLRGTAPTPSQP